MQMIIEHVKRPNSFDCKTKSDNKRMGRIPPLRLCKKHIRSHRSQTLGDAMEMGQTKTSAEM